METQTSIISAAVNSMVTAYSKFISDVAERASPIEYEKTLYDSFYISQEAAAMYDKLNCGGNQDEILNRILFLESMIKLPNDCRRIYDRIVKKDHFAKTGFEAICYFYKREYDWAYKMAQEYYSVDSLNSHAVLLAIYARLLLEQEDFAQAKAFAYKTIELVPALYEAHRILSEVYEKTGQRESADVERQIMSLLDRRTENEAYRIL